MSEERPERTKTRVWWSQFEGPERQRRLALLMIALVIVLAFPFIDRLFRLNLETKAIPIGIFIILALGLNVVVGFAGLLDLGYAAFFAIGAYTIAFLTSPASPFEWVRADPLSFWLAMAASTVVAAIFGVIIGAPTLRLRGDYLAIVTLGFGEIIPLVIRNTPQFTRGVQGMNPIALPELPFVRFGVIDLDPWYYLVIVVVLGSVFLTARLRSSRIGRAWMAVREDEVAAASMGVNLVTTKLFAFALGASFSGFAGSIWASHIQVISPDQFSFAISIFVLAMIILGGMGNIWGVIAGGLILGGFDRVLFERLNELIRGMGRVFEIPFLLEADTQRLKTAVYGAALVIMMLVRPEGLFPSGRRKMELHAAEESEVEAAQQRETLFETQR
ncbi:MAG: branched-chain amino acid ABC transporter permease [Candidatus Limnocylindria bacterium]